MRNNTHNIFEIIIARYWKEYFLKIRFDTVTILTVYYHNIEIDTLTLLKIILSRCWKL